jgi:hypothetical protein
LDGGSFSQLAHGLAARAAGKLGLGEQQLCVTGFTAFICGLCRIN